MKNNKQDLDLFSTVMWGLAEDFGGKVSDDSLSLRFSALQEYSIEDIAKAGTWLLKHRESTFPAVPTTKEIIDAIRSVSQANPRLKAEIEADKVLSTLKEWGRDADALFYDKITMYLMTKRWTFRQLDLMAVDDKGLKWWRKDFVQAYQDIEKNRSSGCDVLPLDQGDNGSLQEIANAAVKRIG